MKNNKRYVQALPNSKVSIPSELAQEIIKAKENHVSIEDFLMSARDGWGSTQLIAMAWLNGWKISDDYHYIKLLGQYVARDKRDGELFTSDEIIEEPEYQYKFTTNEIEDVRDKITYKLEQC